MSCMQAPGFHPIRLAQMKLHGISVESIVDGKDGTMLALVWNMILKFMVTKATVSNVGLKLLLGNSNL